MFVTFCPYGGAIFRSLEIVDENDVINVVSIVLSLFLRFSSQHLLKHWDVWSLSQCSRQGPYLRTWVCNTDLLSIRGP